MTNNDKLINAFSQALGIETSQVTDDLEYNSIAQWDSVAHMTLIAKLEQAFDIMLDTEDIIDMSSPAKAREILSRHEVEF